jgi:hypothetical protein
MQKLSLSWVRSWKPDVLAPALMLVTALLFIYFFGKNISVYLPILSIEVFIAAALISTRNVTNRLFKYLFITLFFSCLSFQLLNLISLSFNIPITDIYYLITHAPQGLPIAAKYALTLFFALYIITLVVEIQIPIIHIRKRYFILIFITPIIFDVFFSANRIYPKDIIKFPNLVGAPIINHYSRSAEVGKFEYWDTPPNSYSLILELTEKHNYVLFIEFESLGSFISDYDENILFTKIRNSFPAYQLNTKFEEKFLGGTLSGELRSLCRIKTYGDIMINPEARKKELSTCIPNILRNNNPEVITIAAHANHGSFYNRHKVYPAIGFKNSIFISSLKKESTSDCDSVQFIACDDAVLNKLQEITDGTQKKLFIHFMSINSHFPYSGKVISKLNSNDNLSAYFNAIDSTLTDLNKFISNSARVPDIVIISGDLTCPLPAVPK